MSDPNLFDVPVRVWVSCRGEITLETMVSDDGDRLVHVDDCTLTARGLFSNIYPTNYNGIYAPRHLLGAVDGAEPAHSVPAHSVHSIGRVR